VAFSDTRNCLFLVSIPVSVVIEPNDIIVYLEKAFPDPGFRDASMTPHVYLRVLLLLAIISASSYASEPTHLRLIDRLDRTSDGYCFDVHGTPGNLRTDLPLFAHNCKPRLTVDSAVVYDQQERVKFIELGLCATIAGVNSRALPGAAVLLRKCGGSTAFFEVDALQKFTLHADGKLELKESGLCLTVGARSAATYSSNDRWRTLFVGDCTTIDASRSRWEFTVP